MDDDAKIFQFEWDSQRHHFVSKNSEKQPNNDRYESIRDIKNPFTTKLKVNLPTGQKKTITDNLKKDKEIRSPV